VGSDMVDVITERKFAKKKKGVGENKKDLCQQKVKGTAAVDAMRQRDVGALLTAVTMARTGMTGKELRQRSQ
jgi:hypothetical protein